MKSIDGNVGKLQKQGWSKKKWSHFNCIRRFFLYLCLAHIKWNKNLKITGNFGLVIKSTNIVFPKEQNEGDFKIKMHKGR